MEKHAANYLWMLIELEVAGTQVVSEHAQAQCVMLGVRTSAVRFSVVFL
jgi:hypothetical protein